jgi:uncharacterized protein YukE
VKRILYNENKKLNAMEKGIFIFSIAVIGLMGITSVKHPAKQPIKPQTTPMSSVKSLSDLSVSRNSNSGDTTPQSLRIRSFATVFNKDDSTETKTIDASDNNGKKYRIVLKDSKPAELYIDNKKISSDQIGDHKETISTIEKMVETEQPGDGEKMKMLKDDREKNLKQLDAERNELIEKLNTLDKERSTLDGASENGFDSRQLWKRAQAEKFNDLLDQLKDQNNGMDNFSFTIPFNFKMDTTSPFNQPLNEKSGTFNGFNQTIKSRLEAKQYNLLLNDKLQSLQNMGDQRFGLLFDEKNNMFQKQLLNDRIQSLIKDLEEGGIIAPGDPDHDVSFELNSDSLIVNGKKQSADMHERLKEKYLKKEGDYMRYSKNKGHTNISININ